MQFFENMATGLAYFSLGIISVCGILSIIISFVSDKFSENFNHICYKIGIYFCLPVYGLSFLSEGVWERSQKTIDPSLNFFLAIVFFVMTILIINRKKIKKIIERWKGKWKW